MADLATRDKWNKAAATLDLMSGRGEMERWLPFKSRLFGNMEPGKILFASLGTGLDISAFPPGMTITAIDISPEMLKRAQPRVSKGTREKYGPNSRTSMTCRTRTGISTRSSPPARSARCLNPSRR